MNMTTARYMTLVPSYRRHMTELERAIRDQPGELRRLAGLRLPDHAKRLAAGERVWLVGTGTSLHAAELGAAMFARAGIDARFASSMEFARWAPLRAGDAVVVLTHTGETAYAQASRRRALDLGAETLSITAEGVGWPEAIETGAKERSHTYTRSYTLGAGRAGSDRRRAGRRGAGPGCGDGGSRRYRGRDRRSGAGRRARAHAPAGSDRLGSGIGDRTRGSAQTARGRAAACRGL